MKKIAIILCICLTAMLLPQTAFAGTEEMTAAGDQAEPLAAEFTGAEDPAEDPASEEPGTEDPSSEEPGTEDPAGEDPGTEDPAAEAPGLQTIDGVLYYILEDGTKATGPVQVEDKLYYFGEDGAAVMTEGWFKGIDQMKRYGQGDGTVVTGLLKIKKSWYFFKPKDGTLPGKGFFKFDGDKYYAQAGGKLVTGWFAKGKRAYYFYESGKHAARQASNTTIGYLKIPKSGHLGEAYALGIKTLNKKGWKLKAAYKFSYKIKYYDRWYRTKTSEKYSLRGFKKGKGNCYVMAATFYIMAKLLGYDVHQVYGKVDLPHSWTEIKQDGKTYVYDPNFRNETGRNGFKIWYGKPGTWRYHKQGALN